MNMPLGDRLIAELTRLGTRAPINIVWPNSSDQQSGRKSGRGAEVRGEGEGGGFDKKNGQGLGSEIRKGGKKSKL